MTSKEFLEELKTLQPRKVVEHEFVREQFIFVYNSIWQTGGESIYEREKIYAKKVLTENPGLGDVTPASVLAAFIDLAVKNLSLEPGLRAMCYLVPRSCKCGKNERGQDIYEKRCYLSISGYGELYLRARAGQIRYADNPVLVYDGDTFEYGERDGRKFVNFSSCFPRRSNRIVACFLKITRADGSIDYSVMMQNDWERLKGFSGKNNAYYDSKQGKRIERPNDLYGTDESGIDAGFLCAKCIKHAFKSYPKLKIGKGSELESQTIEDEPEPTFDPYAGLVPDEQTEVDSFAPRQDYSEGVTITPNAQPAAGTDDIF